MGEVRVLHMLRFGKWEIIGAARAREVTVTICSRHAWLGGEILGMCNRNR
jgi:hypothetical protein